MQKDWKEELAHFTYCQDIIRHGSLSPLIAPNTSKALKIGLFFCQIFKNNTCYIVLYVL